MTSKEKQFSNFGEYLYWSYANLQMLCYAVANEKKEYDKSCYMIRAKAFKAYKEARWNIHDLLQLNVSKIQNNDFCWYCGQKTEPSKLTKDHVFPRDKGGNNNMDNIIMVCKTCNSSKNDMDLFEWYEIVRQEWPPISIIAHYLKNIYFYSLENNLLDKHYEELSQIKLPFKIEYIPHKIPLEPYINYED